MSRNSTAYNNSAVSRNKGMICVPAGMAVDEYLPQRLKYASKESLEICPYDPNHRVKPTRLRGHIIKCAKTHPPLAICYFNATHRMPEDQLQEHLKICPSRIDVAPVPQTPSEELKIKAPPASMPIKPFYNSVDDDDDWD